MKNKVSTKDGSNTLYSQQYNQHFHNVNDGAVFESFQKHVNPALKHHKNKQTLRILDICFGLGYNTFVTLDNVFKHYPNKKIEIYSPEFDRQLVSSLKDFDYPEELMYLQPIITTLANDGRYENKQCTIELYFGDARVYINQLANIDIVYQDAFSSDENKELWTVEYFSDLKNILNEDAIVTTYSIATPVRLAMYEAGFEIYEHTIENGRKATLAYLKKQENGKYIDMLLKQQRKP